MYSIFIFFIVCFSLGYGVNWFLLRFSGNRLAKDAPKNSSRWEERRKPTIGGISFFSVFIFSVLVYFIFSENVAQKMELSVLLIGTGLGFTLGLLDDLKNAPVWAKFGSQFLVGFLFLFFGFEIHLFEIYWLDALITVIWVVGIMNSINMLDNMDGVTAGTTLFIFIGFMILALQRDFNVLNVMILLGVSASIIAFLRYNLHPSRMYMGDVGSQFLGVLLAAFAIKYVWNGQDLTGVELPTKQIAAIASLFIVPLSDTTTVFYKRILRGDSPFKGGRDHTTHHLVYAGMPQKYVAPLYMALTLVGVGITYLIFRVSFEWSLGWFFGIILYNITVFSVLFYIANLHKDKDK